MPNYTTPDPAAFDYNLSGKRTQLILLTNSAGVELALSNFGARIVSLLVPDNRGRHTDVVLGFPSIQSYLNATEPYHGATIGRFANRIANGKFTINGRQYAIEPNNGPNALHGGKTGFHQRVWDGRTNLPQEVEFRYTSADGEEGFPGNLSTTVTYHLTDNNQLIIRYRAETDKPTIINLTNHAFFNLNGEGNGDVLGHMVQINADGYLPVNQHLIPTGTVGSAANSPFDFRQFKAIGQDIAHDHAQLEACGGYDHNYVLHYRNGSGMRQAVATAISPDTGIRLDVYTSEPGLQFYSGNFLDGRDSGKLGVAYQKHHAFCLETQHFPDSPNQPTFPSTLLLPGQVFESETIYKFSVVE